MVSHPSGFEVARHNHSRAQLLYVVKGLLKLVVEDGHWVVPAKRAVWIPSFIEHRVDIIHSATMCNIYLDEQVARQHASQCQVVAVSELLRELMLAMGKMDKCYDLEGADGRLVAVFLDQLAITAGLPLYLPKPSDKRLLKICKQLLTNPAEAVTIAQFAQQLGCSERTLARHFVQQTGITFGQWRQQARLLAALSRIAEGEPVSRVASDLGYQSQSAFIAMFKKALGKTPRQYFS